MEDGVQEDALLAASEDPQWFQKWLSQNPERDCIEKWIYGSILPREMLVWPYQWNLAGFDQ
jgi:hypothetical protein